MLKSNRKKSKCFLLLNILIAYAWIIYKIFSTLINSTWKRWKWSKLTKWKNSNSVHAQITLINLLKSLTGYWYSLNWEFKWKNSTRWTYNALTQSQRGFFFNFSEYEYRNWERKWNLMFMLMFSVKSFIHKEILSY